VRVAEGDALVCFADEAAAAQFDLVAPNLRVIRVAQSASPTRAASAGSARAPTDMLRLTRAVWREDLDVFFSPSVYTYFPLPPGLAAVVTVHDAIAERFPELTLPTARARLFWRAKVALALHQARLILTVSDFAAREIAEVLAVPRGAIRVAGEAPASVYRPSPAFDVAAAMARAGLPADAYYFVYVGGFGPHKHVDRAVAAHAAVCRARPHAPPFLLLVGATDGEVFHTDLGLIRDAIARAGTAELVRWTGFLPDEELRHLHTGSRALLLPSAAEGFGLPAVEAAACGAPVIATTASPLPELLAGGGYFVPPGDVAAMTVAMRILLDDPERRRALGAAARQRAAALTWERGARATLDALREAAA
jgi:glycosyltransferase involved in cell wall biosynthesis